MKSINSIANEWEVQTRDAVNKIQAQINDIRADAKRRITLLEQHKRGLEEALKVYRGAVDAPSLLVLQTPYLRELEALSPGEIVGKSQKDILKLIAARNDDVLVVAQAMKMMKAANVFGNPNHSDSAVYSIILRSPEFVKIEKGIYKVVDIPPRQAARRTRGSSGIGKAIAVLKENDPSLTKKQVLEALIRNGFDFRGKKAVHAVNMAWVKLGFAKEEGPDD